MTKVDGLAAYKNSHSGEAKEKYNEGWDRIFLNKGEHMEEDEPIKKQSK